MRRAAAVNVGTGNAAIDALNATMPDLPEFLRVRNRPPVRAGGPRRAIVVEERCLDWRLPLSAFFDDYGWDLWCREQYRRGARQTAREEREGRPAKVATTTLARVLADVGRARGAAVRRGWAKRVLRLAGCLPEERRFPLEVGVRVATAVSAALDDPKLARRSRAKTELESTAVIHVLDAANPKQEGSDAHARWALALGADGWTVAQYIERGGNLTTLRNAVLRENIELDEKEDEEDGVGGRD